MEISDEALAERIAAEKAEAAEAVRKTLIEGTTWKSVEALKESALAADRKIGEVATAKAAAEAERVRLAARVAELEAAKGAEPKGDKGKAVEPEPKPEEVLATMTDQEEQMLDALVKSDKALGALVLSSGTEGMAKALLSLREQDSTKRIDPANPFKSFREVTKPKPQQKAAKIQDALAAALDNYQKRRNIVSPAGNGFAAAMAGGGDDDIPVRKGTGGMGMLRKAAD